MIRIKVHFWMGNHTFKVIFLGSRKWTLAKIEESARICLLSHEYSLDEVLKAHLRMITFDKP